ncbi:MAG TPA: hypothetical protein VJP77_02350, partial [Planctomycetota bacterium]|nr:hypothetical protein [Planctomycetota bacterium]
CGEPSIRKDGARWIIESTCKVEGGTVKSRSVVSGDFERGFRAETEARYEPPIAGTSTVSSVVEGRWVGACNPGQKHGDVVIPELEQLMRDAGGAQ